MSSVERLLGAIYVVPEADEVENAGLAAARVALNVAIEHDSSGQRRRRLGGPLRAIPLVLASAGALLIAVVALTVLRPHAAAPTLSGPAAGPGADALIHRLAVLRRPQTAADKLPAHLVVNRSANGRAIGGSGLGVIIPSLTRLVATLPDAKLYLAVTTPVRDPDALWSRRYGDLVTIVSVTRFGALERLGLPAAALPNSGLLWRTGLVPVVTKRPLAASTTNGAYDVAIVPDGVARGRWTFADRAGDAGRVASVAVRNNVAIMPLALGTATLLRTTWYAASGRTVATGDGLPLFLARRQARFAALALARAERQHVSAPAKLLAAFAVFSFNSPTGTRTSDGYLISHPALRQIPGQVLLQASANSGLDLRQARHVIAPSGLAMWVVPGQHGICVFEAPHRTRLPYGQSFEGGGGGCSGNLNLALHGGAGIDSDNRSGATVYGVTAKAGSGVTIQITPNTSRTIHPADGVYIVRTPFHFG